ncbi:DUF4136 domain-containing protein [Ketobacter nezhaii]|uniref:DUF4136 domain-containing protein n=1 Tax=Ketobacter sp. MCCC 1A13808 TaxID=2602738 RepID=UPI0018DD8B8F|nr:DUF4136 domain-containing protein [Ketobacter sp. MCCC 1A13808]
MATYDYATDTAFTGYKTYAIQQSRKQANQSLDSGRIEAAIKSSLQGRYQIAEADQADMLVSYYLQPEVKAKQSGLSLGFGFGSGPVGVGVSTSPPVKQETEARLMLDIIDTASSNVVWTAKANRNLENDMKPPVRSDLINDLVTEMLGNFPP